MVVRVQIGVATYMAFDSCMVVEASEKGEVQYGESSWVKVETCHSASLGSNFEDMCIVTYMVANVVG